jgi:hypothetical protein
MPVQRDLKDHRATREKSVRPVLKVRRGTQVLSVRKAIPEHKVHKATRAQQAPKVYQVKQPIQVQLVTLDSREPRDLKDTQVL